MSIETAWYSRAAWLYLLWPLSLLFRLLAGLRRWRLQRAWRLPGDDSSLAGTPGASRPVPVVVVGNISVGGTGKTPLVIALGRALQAQGLRPGVISRGYGGRAPHYPLSVTADTPVEHAGDEALLIARQLQCPVRVDADRCRARDALLSEQCCDVIISDDGLQHYALQRALEIVVIDGQRGLGNGLCLPAGPLREPASRLRQVDYLVVNGGDCADYREHQTRCSRMNLVPQHWVNLRSGERRALDALRPMGDAAAKVTVHALAGIGNPQRFFDTVAALGYDALYHAFPDHYNFTPQDLAFPEEALVLMTSKDAVKCSAFAADNCWYLDIEARLEPDFHNELLGSINGLIRRPPAQD